MAQVRKVWHLLPHDPNAIDRLANSARLSSTLAQLMINRGITDPILARRFFDANLKGLHPPESLPGVTQAVECLWQSIQNHEKICIYGDYDVDGVTGTSILYSVLRRLDVPVEYYVPRRLEEGYGVNAEALRSIRDRDCSVVVTVDCGITSIKEAEEAKRLGLKFIITDHHEMKATLPDATVLVHPRLPGTNYPFGHLSGAGVAFKLAWALATKACGSEKVTPRLRQVLLDSVSLATLGLVADVVPLHDENRIIVKYGLDRLRHEPPMGMKALIESAGLSANEEFRAEDIGYKLAPRMNAAGRLGYAGLVVEMLTTEDAKRAAEIAQHLESENIQRQSIERKMVAQAREQLEGANLADLPAAVLWHVDWHPGVIGIVAGRIAESIGRPVLIIARTEGQEYASGSGRSIPGFALHEALRACESELITHGGHSMAAGFKVAPDKLESLRAKFSAYSKDHFPEGVPPAPRLILDAEIPFSSLSIKLCEEIDLLEPYGAENPKPKFLAGNLQIQGVPRKIGKGELHLDFRVKQGSIIRRAVAFNMADRLDELMSAGGACCLAFTPNINTWQGAKNVELKVIDFQAGKECQLE